jgi:S-formylglutathione hydrolase FrmB
MKLNDALNLLAEEKKKEASGLKNVRWNDPYVRCGNSDAFFDEMEVTQKNIDDALANYRYVSIEAQLYENDGDFTGIYATLVLKSQE